MVRQSLPHEVVAVMVLLTVAMALGLAGFALWLVVRQRFPVDDEEDEEPPATLPMNR